MINKIIKLSFFLFLYNFQSVYCQVWPKIFGGYSNNFCTGVIEAYDKGYTICVQVDPGMYSPQMHAWLVKTDINGNLLWKKTAFSSSYQIAYNGLDNTSDGGIITTGVTNKLDPSNYDIIFIKLNACGEKDWCNIISTSGNSDFGLKIKSIPGGYVALISYFHEWTTKRIWLFKLDLTGNIIWEMLINESNSNISNGEGDDILVFSSNNYLVTGEGYDLSPGQIYRRRPLIIRTDSNANVQWTLPFGHTNGFRGEIATYPNVNLSGSFYMSARHFRDSLPSGDSPCFLKVSSAGEELFYKDLIPNSSLGAASTLHLRNNDSLFISGGWIVNSSPNIGIFKSDTLGNIAKTKIVIQGSSFGLSSALFTYDSNYLFVATANPSSLNTKIFLYKFTRDLEYAPPNTQLHLYDSLCPHPIVSDTMNLDDCGIITNIEEPLQNPGTTRLHIFPNPATVSLTIEMPQFLIRQVNGNGMIITTYYRQWNFTTLEIYDLFGKLMYSEAIPKKTEKVELNVSSWHSGMYVARVVFMNEVVAGAKFVIE